MVLRDTLAIGPVYKMYKPSLISLSSYKPKWHIQMDSKKDDLITVGLTFCFKVFIAYETLGVPYFHQTLKFVYHSIIKTIKTNQCNKFHTGWKRKLLHSLYFCE